jgi:exonuclease SbcD
MALKIVHTADWHLGQTFHEYDRTYEHEQFLKWLLEFLSEKAIDVVLISGDVFDVSNPSAASVSMFYKFLVEATKSRQNLQIVIIAGNHDSAARLEAPNPLLQYLNIRIVGSVEHDQEGQINYEPLIIPLKNSSGDTEAWCMAIPFLRPGDFPVLANTASHYIDGINTVYKEAYQFALSKKLPGQAIIAMGHLHTMDAVILENDKSERLIMGGIELVPATTFNQNIAYTALGHIHKSQMIGGKPNIRYSGSPLPMSFSEHNYKHRVLVFELDGEKAGEISEHEIPITTRLVRMPNEHRELALVLDELDKLPEAASGDGPAPYLEVRVLLPGPEPALRHKIESVIGNKHVRLAKIDARKLNGNSDQPGLQSFDQLQDMNPLHVFSRMYESRYKNTLPVELEVLFRQVSIDISIDEKETLKL